VFPALPALALLVALALSRTDEQKTVKWAFRVLAILALLVLAAGAGFGIWMAVTGHGFENTSSTRSDVISETDFSILTEMPAEILWQLTRPAVVTIVSLAVGLLFALHFENRRRRMEAVMCVAAVMIVVCGMTHWSLIICEDMISSRKFGLAVAREALPGNHMVVMGDYESANSLSFYQPLHIEVFDGVAYSLIPGMKFPDAPRIVLTKEEFVTLWRAEERVFVLLPKARLGELKLGGTEILEVMDRILIRNH
jgi:hypothetical protein